MVKETLNGYHFIELYVTQNRINWKETKVAIKAVSELEMLWNIPAKEVRKAQFQETA